MRFTKILAKQFFKDYRLPLETTFLFVLIVVIMLLARTFDRIALANVLGSKTGNSTDYAALLSKDKVESPTKNDINTPEVIKETIKPSTNTPTQFTVSPNPPPTSVSPAPGTPSVPTPPFSANIVGLVLEGSAMECSGGGLNIQDCSKRYIFRAGIRAINGPGSIHFSWQGSVPEIIENGVFSVGSGETYTPLRKEVKLSCVQPMMFSIQLSLSQPNSDQSNVLEQYHSCGTTTPPPTIP